jgi:hypothetical protein
LTVDIDLRAWSKLSYEDPEPVLRRFRTLEVAHSVVDLDPLIRRLRSSQLKGPREVRNAAIFTHGMAAAIGTKVYFAAIESSDYDFVTTWQIADQQKFCSVQLKELVPVDLNSNQRLPDLLASLEKYQPTRTALAVLLNKPWQMDVKDIPAVARRFSQLWFFWLASPDGNNWKIQGDALAVPATYDFRYPQLAPHL